jgi:transposase
LANALKIEAWESNEWEDLGILAENEKGAAHYKSWRTQREIGEETFGFTVVHSSNLAERTEKNLQKSVKKIKTTLERQSKEVATTVYACEADARREGQKLQKKVDKKGFSSELEIKIIEKLSYGHRGRPKKGEEPKKETEWHAEVKVGSIKMEVYEQKKRLASTFVLIHRLKEEKSSEDILRSYKNQDKVEQGFKFLKQPQYLGAVYTKKTDRVKALGYIFLFVLLLGKYLEYRVRIGMKQSEGEVKIGGQKVMKPSAKTILEILDRMLIYSMNGVVKLPDVIDKDVLNVIRWAGFNEDIYIHGYTGDYFFGVKWEV